MLRALKAVGAPSLRDGLPSGRVWSRKEWLSYAMLIDGSASEEWARVVVVGSDGVARSVRVPAAVRSPFRVCPPGQLLSRVLKEADSPVVSISAGSDRMDADAVIRDDTGEFTLRCWDASEYPAPADIPVDAPSVELDWDRLSAAVARVSRSDKPKSWGGGWYAFIGDADGVRLVCTSRRVVTSVLLDREPPAAPFYGPVPPGALKALRRMTGSGRATVIVWGSAVGVRLLDGRGATVCWESDPVGSVRVRRGLVSVGGLVPSLDGVRGVLGAKEVASAILGRRELGRAIRAVGGKPEPGDAAYGSGARVAIVIDPVDNPGRAVVMADGVEYPRSTAISAALSAPGGDRFEASTTAAFFTAATRTKDRLSDTVVLRLCCDGSGKEIIVVDGGNNMIDPDTLGHPDVGWTTATVNESGYFSEEDGATQA